MMMPGMDGIALVQALRAMNPDIKVIAASGLADHNAVAKATAAGVQHFLQKPYTAESLLKVMADLRENVSSDTRRA
jgi:CheY-like chemotaxis protein